MHYTTCQTHLSLISRHIVSALIVLISCTLPGILTGQNSQLEGSENVPVRVTRNIIPTILGGPQLPPYENMATFLSNAFRSPQAGVKFVQDSSICANGIPGTRDFEASLLATYEYNAEQLKTIIFWKIDGDDKSRFSRKEFTYEEGRLERYVYLLWNDNDGIWVPGERELLFYNSAGHTDSAVVQNWTGSEWVNTSQQTLTLNVDKRPLEFKYSRWNNGIWVPVSRSIALYNGNLLPDRVRHEQYDGNDWITLVQETYGYDPGLNLILVNYLLEQRDSLTGELVQVSREAYHYNLRGFYSTRVIQTWNDSAMAWEDSVRDKFGYTGKGIWTNWTRQVWSGSWVDTIHREFVFSEGRQVDIEQVWDPVMSEWINNRRRFVQHDEYGNLVWERNFQHWNQSSGEWLNVPTTKRCQHFWSEKGTSGTSFVYENEIDCKFLNPYMLSSEIRCLSLDQNTRYSAHIFDQMGRMVYKNAFMGGSTFSLRSDVPTGMYYLFVSNRENVLYKGKMIINN